MTKTPNAYLIPSDRVLLCPICDGRQLHRKGHKFWCTDCGHGFELKIERRQGQVCFMWGGLNPMLTHAQIWLAIDRLATRAGLSTSGLAVRAGLDATTFNKSKRMTPDGWPRWPSTESIAKALTATATPFDVFVGLIGPTSANAGIRA